MKSKLKSIFQSINILVTSLLIVLVMGTSILSGQERDRADTDWCQKAGYGIFVHYPDSNLECLQLETHKAIRPYPDTVNAKSNPQDASTSLSNFQRFTFCVSTRLSGASALSKRYHNRGNIGRLLTHQRSANRFGHCQVRQITNRLYRKR